MKKLFIFFSLIFILSSCRNESDRIKYLNDTFKKSYSVIKIDNSENYLVIDSTYVRIIELDGLFNIFSIEKIKIRK